MISPLKSQLINLPKNMSFAGVLSRTFALSLVAFIAISAPNDAFAAKNKDSKLDDALQNTFALVQNHEDPIAQKLVTWLYVTETRIPVHAPDLITFVRQNPQWPRMHSFRAKIEKGIAATVKPFQIVEWFDKNPPESFDGMKAYVTALVSQGQPDKAKTALQKFWRDTDLKKNEVASLAGSYKNFLTTQDHYNRLDHLIWEGRYGEAEYMLAFVTPAQRALGHARILLAKSSPKSEAAIAAVPAQLQNDESLLFERMRFRRRKNMDAGALEILAKMPKNSTYANKWWEEINVLARREIEVKNYAAAFALAKKHTLTDGVEFAQAEWLLGWLALRCLNQPAEGYKHFDALYRSVGSAISKSRAAYWAARAAEALPDSAIAMQWDKIAALYPSTFYGQLSYNRLNSTPTLAVFAEKPVPPERAAAFDKSETVRAVRLLHKTGLKQFIDPFLAKLLSDAKTPHDYYLAAKLARETGRNYYAVEANKEAQQTLGIFLMTEGYPVLKAVTGSQPEKSLVHAIIHRESMFEEKALSPAGASGLMQLMPGTAKMMAKKKGRVYKQEKLTEDTEFNVALGSAYLHQLIENYGGFYPMAIAAYNAGPGRVTQWIEMFGDPRKGEMNIIDWVEHIPIYETRNYVQRVMESYYMYRLRFNQPPKTIFDFMPRQQ